MRFAGRVAAVAVVLLIASGCGWGGDDKTVCRDGTERFDCTDGWHAELAVFLGIDPALAGFIPGESLRGLSVDEQVVAVAEAERLQEAVRRADQACQLMQGIEPRGERLGVTDSLARWLDDNVCPGDRFLVRQ